MVFASYTFESVTLGHIRGHGCRDLLVYCCDTICNHGVTLTNPDDTPGRSLGARMASTKCGRLGAEVRPDWSPHTSQLFVAGQPQGQGPGKDAGR
jgi:hypothetical protein